MQDCDLVIRGAAILDGTGRPEFEADVAVSDGKIVDVGVGGSARRGREEIDARGLHLTPGFVDIHTHFDGQATWSNRLNPSSHHGATTVVMGNCGVGIAPCRPTDHDVLIHFMEGVEDIPEVVLTAGIPWGWESFPDYLDFLAGRAFDVDVAAYLPHAPLRVFAMGQRGADREPATAADIAAMARLAREAVEAGAIGFSTSRTLNHRSSERRLMPNVTAAENELTAIAAALGEVGKGVLQVISDLDEPVGDFGMLRRLVERSGRPLSLSLIQFPNAPTRWSQVLGLIEQAHAEGLPIKAQVIGRPIGLLMGLAISRNPFSLCPSYQAIAHLDVPARLRALREPEFRVRLLQEYPVAMETGASSIYAWLDSIYPMSEPPNYEPQPQDSIAARAHAKGLDPVEYAYDLLIENDGTAIFYNPSINYSNNSIAAAETMIRHPDTLFGLGDGGAHMGMICDASVSTYMLTVGGGARCDPAGHGGQGAERRQRRRHGPA